jgi:hypothetical protein
MFSQNSYLSSQGSDMAQGEQYLDSGQSFIQNLFQGFHYNMMSPQLPEQRVYSEQEEVFFLKFDGEIAACLANIKNKIHNDAPCRSKILQQVQ